MSICRVIEGELGYEISAVLDAATELVKKYRYVIFKSVKENTELLEGFASTFHEAQQSAEWWLRCAGSALQKRKGAAA